ncbi:sigma-70 family RNA polymerase sigma factor [Streptomyces sp. A7024]|uniref:Sigma-70 family RNA polymerase sigma factor n=1 Tax=Streptomyces coryli TaxID=1128680 RepID=A0A6G4TWI1_9ACTN|nr:sigma-70 family RNA polymerase sigma factor [Streptomyces coryli]
MSDSTAPQLGDASSRTETVGFEAFYRETTNHLVAFLINQGASLHLAADIAQETMIKAYQRWSGIDSPRAWVHTVASRALIREFSSTRERPVGELPEPTSLLPGVGDVVEWELRDHALTVLRRLPPRQRQVVAWTLSGFTPGEIAGELGITPNAVSASLRKARRAVSAELRPTTQDRGVTAREVADGKEER